MSKAEPTVVAGKIIVTANPCIAEPCLPGVVFGIETGETNYVITVYFQWIVNDLIIDNTEYFIDDRVEVTGVVSVKQDINSNVYNEIEIISIRKMASHISEINLIPFSIHQTPENVIISFETVFLGNLKLYDLSGKICFEQTILNESLLIISKQSIASGFYILCVSDGNKKTTNIKIVF